MRHVGVGPVVAPRAPFRGLTGRRLGAWCGLWAILLAVAGGCRDAEEIEDYSLPKRPQDRMLAGLLMGTGRAWSFKVVGPSTAMADHVDAVKKFLAGLQANPGAERPTWSAPEAWRERQAASATGDRIGTYTLAPGIELAINQLPGPTSQTEVEAYTLQNINRWRGQMRLAPLGREELAAVEKIKTSAGEIAFVDLIGKFSGGGMTAPPMGPVAPAAPSTPQERPKIEHQPPEGWVAAGNDTFSVLAYEVVDGDRRARITVSPAAGDLLLNVNRWRGQLRLPQMTADELAKAVRKVAGAGGASFDVIELTAEPNANPREAIFGAVTRVGGTTWFVKFKGDAAVAAREKSRFEAFIASLKFPGA